MNTQYFNKISLQIIYFVVKKNLKRIQIQDFSVLFSEIFIHNSRKLYTEYILKEKHYLNSFLNSLVKRVQHIELKNPKRNFKLKNNS